MFQLFFWRESERDHSPKGGNPTLARPKPPNVANLLMPKRKKKKKKGISTCTIQPAVLDWSPLFAHFIDPRTVCMVTCHTDLF